MEKLNLQAGMWRKIFHAFTENEKPNKAALEEKIKFLQQSIEYLESENKPVPQNIRDQKASFEEQLAKLT